MGLAQEREAQQIERAKGQERGKKRSRRATVKVALDGAWATCSTTGLESCNALVVDAERKPLQGRFRTRAVEMGSTGVRCQSVASANGHTSAKRSTPTNLPMQYIKVPLDLL